MVPNEKILRKLWVWYIWTGGNSTFLLDFACYGPKRKDVTKIVGLIYLDWREFNILVGFCLLMSQTKRCCEKCGSDISGLDGGGFNFLVGFCLLWSQTKRCCEKCGSDISGLEGGFWMDHQDTYWPSIDGPHLPTSRPNGNNCITKYSYNQISFTLCVLKKGVQQAWINLPEELYLCQFFRVQSVCRKYESTAQKTLSEEENNCCNTCTHCKGKV